MAAGPLGEARRRGWVACGGTGDANLCSEGGTERVHLGQCARKHLCLQLARHLERGGAWWGWRRAAVPARRTWHALPTVR